MIIDLCGAVAMFQADSKPREHLLLTQVGQH